MQYQNNNNNNNKSSTTGFQHPTFCLLTDPKKQQFSHPYLPFPDHAQKSLMPSAGAFSYHHHLSPLNFLPFGHPGLLNLMASHLAANRGAGLDVGSSRLKRWTSVLLISVVRTDMNFVAVVVAVVVVVVVVVVAVAAAAAAAAADVVVIVFFVWSGCCSCNHLFGRLFVIVVAAFFVCLYLLLYFIVAGC